MWLSRNTAVLDSFPHRNGKLTPVLCNQVTQCSGSLTFRFVSTTSTNDDLTIWRQKKELWIMLNCPDPQHSTCELPHIHLFLPKTDWVRRNLSKILADNKDFLIFGKLHHIQTKNEFSGKLGKHQIARFRLLQINNVQT